MQCALVGVALAGGPAVSAPNGSLEFNLGTGSAAAVIYGADGSLSVPLGSQFGLQADFGVQNDDLLTGTAALHVFTRDPSSYLVGVTAGIVRSGSTSLGAVGAEGELYLGSVSLEGWAGYAALDYGPPAGLGKSGLFAIGDIAFYPTDDVRLVLGASTVLGYNSLKLGAEFQPAGQPFSLTAEAHYAQDGRYAAIAGVKFNFGDSGKSLIDSNRQDDPPDRGFDLFMAAGAQATQNPGDFTNRPDCEAAGFTWFGNGEYCG